MCHRRLAPPRNPSQTRSDGVGSVVSLHNTTCYRRVSLYCQLMLAGVLVFALPSMVVVQGLTFQSPTQRSSRSRYASTGSSRHADGSRTCLQASGTNTNELLSLRRGSTVALVTPFDPTTGDIDVASLRQLFQYHLESNTDNLCLLGTTAEAGVMSMAERQLVLKIAAEEVKGRIPIMVGCGTINPTSIQAMVSQAKDNGADAALIVTPYYVKPPQRSLIRHFVDAAGYGLPVVIYNVPSRTGVDMTDASIAAAAAAHNGIVAVKDATGQLARVTALRERLDTHPLLLYSGDDATSVDFTLAGGDGCISVTANVAARRMHDAMSAALAHDATTAQTVNAPLLALHDTLFCEANPIPVKYALSQMGLIRSPYCRPPLDALDASYYSVVQAALRQASLVQLPKS